MEPIFYKGFTIEEDHFINPYSKEPSYMFYPTEQGAQHDADGDSEGFRYTGNCKWTDDILEAKLQIDELVPWKVVIEKKVNRIRYYTVTPFTWFGDAVKFALQFNGQIIPEIQSV
jgi:hypothetical protein